MNQRGETRSLLMGASLTATTAGCFGLLSTEMAII
jgi:hypothetical protein